MGGSLKLGTYAGIGVYVHWTFVLLLAWVAWAAWRSAQAIDVNTWTVVAFQVGFVLAIFFCVVLHEYGHALTARRFGIRTRDITLLPIGGVARLERMPDDPRQELLVALAGPAVNVVIAAVLWAALLPAGGLFAQPVGESPEDVFAAAFSVGGFVRQLVFINVLLVLFNMIPAFPMDGGRVLRALLAHRFDYARATRIAAKTGQVIAVGFAIVGLFTGAWTLLLIALFVFMGAAAEAQVAEQRGSFSGVPVSEAMVTRFKALAEESTLADASEELLAGSQQDFPVMSDGRIVGVLPRTELLKALAQRGLSTPVREVMRRGCQPVGPETPLERVLQRMQEANCPLVPVVEGDRLVGLVTLENVGELLMIRSALGQRQGQVVAGSGRPAR